MSSRSRAICAVLLGSAIMPFFIVSAAVTSLVTLRRGEQEGGLLLLWALLPAAGWLLLANQPAPALVLVGAVVLAVVLRATASWVAVLLSSILLGLGFGLIVEWFHRGEILQAVELATEQLDLGQLELRLTASNSVPGWCD